MSKIYRSKPSKGKFELSLEGKDQHYHHRVKAKLLADSGLPQAFQFKNFTINVIVPPHVRDTNVGHKDEWLELSIEAFDETGKQIFIDNPIQFQNPPYKVDDGTWHKEPHIHLGEVDVPNQKDDPLESLKNIIGDLVEMMAKAGK